MQTGDGLLVRLATAGASLIPAQLAALCAAAERHGNSLVEITARGNFQIRGLTAESATALARDIEAMDLGLRDGVPVETNPLAGLDPTEFSNAAPLAAAIREAIDATDLASRLAPKVSVVIDGGGRIGLGDIAADVRLSAIHESAGTTWLISTGGDAATAQALGIADDDATAKAATLVILEALAARGRDARARDLVPAEMNALLSPFTGRGCRQAGEGPRQVQQTKAQPLIRPYGAPSPRERGEGIPLTDGRIALPVALPFGSMRAAELIAFLESAQSHRVAELRLAPGRGLILICGSERAASDTRGTARAAGLVIDAADPRARIFACSGSAGCASGHIAAREVAAFVARQLGDAAPEFELHISGCPKGCAHPAPAELTLVGTENGPLLVESGSARGTGISFGNQDIAARLASEVRRTASSQTQLENRRPPHPAHAFAGE
ncbi:MAG: precorrin-3B synthase [Rhizobiaceae bacterium]